MVHPLLERFLHFLIMYELPDWLKREDLMRLLPTRGIPSIASFRSWIALVDDSAISTMCTPRPRCYGDDVREVADKVLREVFHRLSSSHEYRNRYRKYLDEVDKIIEEGLKKIRPVVCTELKNLGCFIPASKRANQREPDDLMQYPGPLILVNMEGIERIRSTILEKYGEVLSDWDKNAAGRYILGAVIMHEVTHSYTDLAHEGSPAKKLQRHTQHLYYEVIEESLATYYELGELLDYNGILGQIIAVELLSGIPIEYRAGHTLYTLLRKEQVRAIIEKWTTGASIGTPIAVFLLYFLDPLDYRYHMYMLRELSGVPLVFQETPIQIWKILALELIRSAKADDFKLGIMLRRM